MKKKRNRTVVSFDKEIVTEDNAVKFLSNRSFTQTIEMDEKISGNDNNNYSQLEQAASDKSKLKIKKKSKEQGSNSQKTTSHFDNKKSKRKKLQKASEVIEDEDNESTRETPKKKIKKDDTASQVDRTEEPEKNEAIPLEKPEIAKGESIRAQKRKKHATLLAEKRLKSNIAAQQQALNYLSKWKHSREEWKFEKRKQIWLQQNLFDRSKIPDEFWNTVVDYFSGSRGVIRNNVIKNALQIIEKEETSEEQNTEENYLLILQRARDIVQSLQE